MHSKTIIAFTLFGAALYSSAPVAAEDTSSVGTHSDCKKLKGKDRTNCTKCLNSGDGFFNKVDGKWQCGGDLGGTTVAGQKKGDPWPKALKSMPEQQKSYVTIPAGTFHIGTPAPADGSYRTPSELDSDVTITRPFMMKTTEVTEGEWYFVMKEMPEYYKAGSLERPIVNVSWLDAVTYLNALSKLEKLEACYTIKGKAVTWKGLDCTGYRLPTDAEWEYAGRGGSKAPVYGAIAEISWNSETSNLDGRARRQPVGGKKANAHGLFDMLGNASELTWDLYKADAFEKASTDPVTGGFEVTDVEAPRTVRGMAFTSSPDYATIAARMEGPSTGADTVGFRPVRTVKK